MSLSVMVSAIASSKKECKRDKLRAVPTDEISE